MKPPPPQLYIQEPNRPLNARIILFVQTECRKIRAGHRNKEPEGSAGEAGVGREADRRPPGVVRRECRGEAES